MIEPSLARRRARLLVFIVLGGIILAVVATLVVGVLTTPETEPLPSSDTVLTKGVPCRLQSACFSS
ncbi:MAG: hypothetical protein NTW26_06370 [bacterium]|nr:hypothetical protein [bacterium]